MALQTTRGSLESKMYAIAETLKLSVKTARDYPELKKDVLAIIGHIEKEYLAGKDKKVSK